MKRSFLFAIVACFCLVPTTHVSAEPLRYNRDVRPILSDHCFACHGPDKASQKAGLRLDMREAATAKLESGEVAIVPGKPNAGVFAERILSDDVNIVMPPPSSHKTLSPAQKKILLRWIAEGAVYEKHWAFLPVDPVKVPTAADLPESYRRTWGDWARNPIDWFILRRLAEADLTPSLRAEAHTLARRSALDLTGLPPQPEFAAKFDPAHPSRYVDALFQSPHYGERMAVDWLDAARFADTQGYQVDRDQDMHAFRDWVIQAFNRNMPFDQFTIEQLAGDLLPDATPQQKIATGFHRNHMVNQEGGIIAAEFVAEYTADRVETTAAVWMGQTFTCTRCHDHKYDPFTQRDYYGLKAFLANVGEQGDGGQDAILLPDAEIDGRLASLEKDATLLRKQLKELSVGDVELTSWTERLVSDRLRWTPFEIHSVSGKVGEPTVSADRTSVELKAIPQGGQAVKLSVNLPRGPAITALRLEATGQKADAQVRLGFTFAQQGKRGIPLTAAREGIAIKSTEAAKIVGSDRRAAIAFTATKAPDVIALVWEPASPLSSSQNKGAAQDALDFSFTLSSSTQPSTWRLLYTTAPADQLIAQEALETATKPAKQRTVADAALLRREFLASSAEAKRLTRQIAALDEQITALKKHRPTAFVMQERAKPKDTYILMRGSYDKPGETVTADVPSVLPPLPADSPRNRLGLARWLVDGRHPLTARVTVNRLWQSVFGIGLVRTSEDFGSQGELPSHPELLDWLAGEFVKGGWDVQHLLRLILTSSTYQQSSRTNARLQAVDPDNRLLARGPRFRLQAEFVRDQALAAAGLLSERIGGRSVKPYHPPGLYELVTAGSTTNVYVEDKGEGLRRRSMYSYWKRSVPQPAMLAFDAPGREICSLRRPRSNTPLQALNLMNDPTYVEASRHLAARMLAAGGDADSQIAFGYRLLLIREPSPAETAVLRRSFERNRKEFANRPEAAVGLLKAGASPVAGKFDPAELAAMTVVAGTMLCLDETITKE